ncbi:major facilitator superfamily transporter protein [Elasticomyces elasticus]|nr:major facilitator superfamily transporter protein [Elasticomyces elasticus]
MARSPTLRLVGLALANVLLLVAILAFAQGFFPYKPLLPGLATLDDEQDVQQRMEAEQEEAVFDRVIFMVVDALRSDFVYGYHSGFDFTQSLIRDGAAIPFTAHASPPTVTMPRVKALTTGSVPSFADLIFNLDESGSGSTLATQDTWLAQIRARGGKLIFYGDDTWLRLFPGDFFERSDGTSSFFVSDFTEVDNNVTRHLPDELQNSDWDAMIMHYLGLDHIGHKTGPQGPNMLPKQREMDGIVRTIYEAMETKSHLANTLLIMAGDHGMNAGGNHGGSGPGETEPALLFASPKLKQRRGRQEYSCPTHPKAGTDFHYYRKVQQSDIVPTLAGLMGLPIPKNSLGVFIQEMSGLWSMPHSTTLALWHNAVQIKRIVDAAYGAQPFGTLVQRWTTCLSQGDDGAQIDCGEPNGAEDGLARYWAYAASRPGESLVGHEVNSNAKDEHIMNFLNAAQEELSNAASSYDIPRMTLGIIFSAVALALAIASLPAIWPASTAGMFFAATSLLYGVMMFASSYVEEEQHFWYWMTPAWTVLLTVKSLTKDGRNVLRVIAAGTVVLAVHRLAVRWNQTGQKHAGAPDIVHAFFSEHHLLMWVLLLATYARNWYVLVRRTFLALVPTEFAVAAGVALTIPAIIFKLNFTQADAPELVQGLAVLVRQWTEPFGLVLQGQLTFSLIGVAAIATAVLSIGLARGTAIGKADGPAVDVTLAERLHHLLTLFLITQSRAPNIPLFLGMEVQLLAFAVLLGNPARSLGAQSPRRNASLYISELATSTLLCSHVYFFCMGGSNSISSVDLSNAYNGITNYNVVVVGVLLFSSNWAGPVWWCSAAVLSTFTRPVKTDVEVSAAGKGERAWVRDEREALRREAKLEHVPSAGGIDLPNHWLVYCASMTAFVATSLLAVMVACTALRTHLFIWTVFSPKYLYAMAWCVGWHIMVNIGFGSLLRWLGQIA